MPTLAQSYILTQKGFYMRPVTIDNTQNSNNLSNYQVLVTLDTASLISAGKMKSDCSNIRFYDSDKATQLSYWVESGTCNTSSTRIWVRVPSIPASSKKTIYLYYGNPLLASASDPVATFLFFDDFTTYRSTSGTWSNLVRELFGGKYVMSIVTGNAETVLTPTFSFSNIGIEFRYYIVSIGSYGPRAGINFKETNTSRNYEIITEIGGGHNCYWISYYDGSTFNVLTCNGTSYSTGVWYRNYFYRSSATGKLVGQIGASTAMTATHTTLTSFNRIGFRTWDSGNKYYIDWVAVRNYSDPEPTVSIGSEIYVGRLPDTM